MAFVGNYSAKAALYSPRWKGVRHDVRSRYHSSTIVDLLVGRSRDAGREDRYTAVVFWSKLRNDKEA